MTPPITTTELAGKKVPNPTGKGGFGDRPEDINAGGRPKNQESFTWWMNFFKNMNVKDFLSWGTATPEDERVVAADLAYNRVFNARKDLAEFKEVADRTEGRAPQTIFHEGGLFSAQKLEIETVEPVVETATVEVPPTENATLNTDETTTKPETETNT